MKYVHMFNQCIIIAKRFLLSESRITIWFIHVTGQGFIVVTNYFQLSINVRTNLNSLCSICNIWLFIYNVPNQHNSAKYIPH